MPRKPALPAQKSDALRVRFDQETLERVHANVPAGGVSDFIRKAVSDALDRLDPDLRQPAPEPEPVAAVVDLEPVLTAIRDASAVTLEAYKGGVGASAKRLEDARNQMARLEQMVRWMANVVGLVARQVGLKDIPVPPLAAAQVAPGAQRPPVAQPPAQPPSASSPAPVPAQLARKPSPR